MSTTNPSAQTALLVMDVQPSTVERYGTATCSRAWLKPLLPLAQRLFPFSTSG